MDLLADLGRTLGFSFAAGLNLYATVALLGLASRFGWVVLPPQYRAFDHDLIIYTAVVLYAIEFLADKIPWVDTIWDAVHTFIRPIGGAAIAIIALGPSSPTMTAVAALLGGLVAGSSHVTKAGTRVIANASPEPFSNWALSLGEDALVVALGFVALKYPLVALGVTAALLALIAVFAAAIVRAFRRRFGRRTGRTGPVAPGMATALLVAVAAAGMAAQGGGAAPGSGQSPPPQPPRGVPGAPAGPNAQAEPQRPVFRGGANFVRVDAYATKDGQAVTDLTADDFEIYEDNVLQKIENFEHVEVRSTGSPAARVEPRSVRESREMAADPRARVFVIFLDKWHMRMGSGFNVRPPLIRLLQRVIGDEDLVAIMTPEMSALDIQFTRRTDLLAARLQSQLLPDLGYRDRLSSLDQTEENYRYCYPPTGYERSISAIARDMIDRRREKMTLDAVEDLIIHLDGLREERKAILLVSEGWLLYRENRALAEIARPQIPGIGTGPTGQIGTSDRNNPYGARQSECDRDRLMLANLDNDRRFRDLLDQANRANASFYTIDPAGLRVFDADVGPEPAPPLEVDSAMLRQRIDTLRVAAENTDGVAVVNSNDIDGGLKRVVADLTSYYLFGYSSTNTKLDGRFRSIKVRVKRPGVDVRARRGYRAPTEAEVAARASVAAAPIISEDEAALNRAVTSLEAVRANAPFRLQVSPGWWTPPGPALPGKAPGAEPALWIYGEIETKRPGGDDWSQGGQAEVSILSDKGDTVTTYRVPIAAGASTFVTRFPRSEEDVWLDPGSYAVRVRVKPSTGGLSTLDTARFDVPKTPAAGSFALGLPVYARRGQATGNVEVMTADLRYRRVERIAVEISATLAPDSVTGELLDRKGKPIALPVTASTVQKDAVVWVRGDMPLASLAPGDYVLRLTATKGTEKKQVLAPFRIVP